MDKKTLKKHDIIRKSFSIMFENGYNGTGVKDLTDAADIPKGSLYNYFANKEDYAKEAILLYYNEMNKKQFDHLVNDKLAPLERIKSFYSTMIQTFNNEQQCKFGCFVGNITQEMSGTSAILREVTNQIHCEIARKIKHCLADAVMHKAMEKNTNVDILAEFITNSWQGSLLKIKATNNKKSLDDFYTVLVEILLK